MVVCLIWWWVPISNKPSQRVTLFALGMYSTIPSPTKWLCVVLHGACIVPRNHHGEHQLCQQIKYQWNPLRLSHDLMDLGPGLNCNDDGNGDGEWDSTNETPHCVAGTVGQMCSTQDPASTKCVACPKNYFMKTASKSSDMLQCSAMKKCSQNRGKIK